MQTKLLLVAGTVFLSMIAAAQPSVDAMPVSATSDVASTATSAPPAKGDIGLAEIVVTAQKRSQLLTDVPITISVASGQQLSERGITNTADLGKIVSGFVFVPAPYGEPVYVVRGIGTYDSGIGSAPTVAVYTDQAPIPFSIMTAGAGLDLERVEVLKGPQGTLFGTNTTGGAINYIAAKPTDQFEAGGSTTYERFDKATINGFISGPLTSTLNARLALEGVTGGAWQESITRPGDTLGNSRFLTSRLLLDWHPGDKLKVAININGFSDRGDAQAAQLVAITPVVPGNADPGLLASPLAKPNARSADWDASPASLKDNHFLQGSGRIDYSLTDNVLLTSLSTYSHINVQNYQDLDGSAALVQAYETNGTVKDFSQELRAQITTDKLVDLVGLSYQHSDSKDDVNISGNTSVDRPFGPGSTPFTNPETFTNQSVNNYGIFTNLDYHFTHQLGAQLGARYSWDSRSAQSCSEDNTPGKPLNAFFNFLDNAIDPVPGGHPLVTRCYTLNNVDGSYNPGEFDQHLNEHNISFRGALDYKFDSGTLVFGSVSRGYKGAIISNISSAIASQLLPAKQERLDDYEIGFKTPLFDRRVFLNVSGFYYDYKDKQLRARTLDPVFSLIETLVTVPRSRIDGIDVDLSVKPVSGLTLTVSGTYLNSKILGSFKTSNGLPVYDQAGQSGNFGGSPLSYTPKFTGNFDAEYRWTINESFKVLLGASETYHSGDNAALQLQGQPLDANFHLPEYALLDLRAGVISSDDRWRVEVFGRNVTNKYYWTTVFQDQDTRHRYAGMPSTYGITLGYKY